VIESTMTNATAQLEQLHASGMMSDEVYAQAMASMAAATPGSGSAVDAGELELLQHGESAPATVLALPKPIDEANSRLLIKLEVHPATGVALRSRLRRLPGPSGGQAEGRRLPPGQGRPRRRQARRDRPRKGPVRSVEETLGMAESYRELPPPGPIHPGSGRTPLRKRLGTLLAPLIALAVKAKSLLLLVGNFKLLATFGSMAVSIVAYGAFFGFTFAIGFVLLLLLHEMGHVIQLRREGVKAGAPIFIPFLGAVIASKSLGKDAAAEARVGLAGPILGSIATLVPLAIWLATGDEFWRALAYLGFVLNLFNLIPVVPLDGGRAMAALSPVVWIAGLAGLIVVAVIYPSPILVLIVVFGAYESYRRWKSRNLPQNRTYYAIPGRTRALVAVVYLGLAAALSVGVAETFVSRGF
jgi:Zn-dependent protease